MHCSSEFNILQLTLATGNWQLEEGGRGRGDGDIGIDIDINIKIDFDI